MKIKGANYKEILGLADLEISNRKISSSCGCYKTTVLKVLTKVHEMGLSSLARSLGCVGPGGTFIGACVKDIEYHADRKQGKARDMKLTAGNYIQEGHNAIIIGTNPAQAQIHLFGCSQKITLR